MSLAGRRIVITGAGRGLGAALGIAVADLGAKPVLLGRSAETLDRTARTIAQRTGSAPATFVCDLADADAVARAADEVLARHPDIDVLVNSGAQWSSGPLAGLADADIAATVASMLTGTIGLTRRLLPALRTRPYADIHTVVSMSGLQYARLRGSSVAFRAAKAGQDGFVQGLVEELAGTNVRVTSIYPGIIEDVSPEDPRWSAGSAADGPLTNRHVVEAILFILSAPPNVAVRSMVIERNRSDFLN
jgi:NAD(P)-dependent dehydrogenase (short-subunit alcohol dehydrogenase family)